VPFEFQGSGGVEWGEVPFLQLQTRHLIAHKICFAGRFKNYGTLKKPKVFEGFGGSKNYLFSLSVSFTGL